MQLDDRTLFLLCWRGQRVGAREEWKPEVYGNINCNIAQYFAIEKAQSSESQQQ